MSKADEGTPDGAERVQPSQRPRHHPSVDPQPAAMLGGGFGQDRLNPEPASGLPMRHPVIGPVPLASIRLAPRASPLATNRRNGRNLGQPLGPIMPISSPQ
jgi:hypothetical protein